MKTTAAGMIVIAALLAAVTSAFAATTAQNDGSQLAIYIFLGMCAMIIVVQLLPIIFLFFAFAKALVQGKKETAAAPAEVVIEK
jgi:hypothetical protein